MEFNPNYFTDQNGTQIQLGDIVKVTKGNNKCNRKWVFVFSIPQHRYGFILNDWYKNIQADVEKGYYKDKNILPHPFVVDYPHLDFYYTPKSKQEILKFV